MPKLYAKCPFLFIFVRFMQYFSSILHNILLFKWCFLCLLQVQKQKHYQNITNFRKKSDIRGISKPQYLQGENRYLHF